MTKSQGWTSVASEAATPMTHSINATAEPVTRVIYAANVMAERDGRAGSVSGQMNGSDARCKATRSDKRPEPRIQRACGKAKNTVSLWQSQECSASEARSRMQRVCGSTK